MPIGEIFPTQ